MKRLVIIAALALLAASCGGPDLSEIPAATAEQVKKRRTAAGRKH